MATPPKFRPRARLLQLLGDQLIGSSRLAVFELVKNAYDADASRVRITFHDLETDQARIVVRDNGEGMDREIITNVWLEPGAVYRERQRQKNERTQQFHRLPLGEKGVGRFAVHKLGTSIKMNTKRAGKSEFGVAIDWNDYARHKYMDDYLKLDEPKAPQWVLAQVQTACDFAQGYVGPIPYLLAAIVPTDRQRKKKDGQELKLPDSVWQSPRFLKSDSFGDKDFTFEILHGISYPMTITALEESRFKVLGRLKDQIVSSISHEGHSHGSRPGFISFR